MLIMFKYTYKQNKNINLTTKAFYLKQTRKNSKTITNITNFFLYFELVCY